MTGQQAAEKWAQCGSDLEMAVWGLETCAKVLGWRLNRMKEVWGSCEDAFLSIRALPSTVWQ